MLLALSLTYSWWPIGLSDLGGLALLPTRGCWSPGSRPSDAHMIGHSQLHRFTTFGFSLRACGFLHGRLACFETCEACAGPATSPAHGTLGVSAGQLGAFASLWVWASHARTRLGSTTPSPQRPGRRRARAPTHESFRGCVRGPDTVQVSCLSYPLRCEGSCVGSSIPYCCRS